MYDLSKIKFWQGLIVVASAWIAGMFLQHGGILLFGLVKDKTYKYRRNLKKAKTDNEKKQLSEDIKQQFLKKTKISIEAGSEFNRVLERITVIKEACGNWSVSLAYTAILISLLLILLGDRSRYYLSLNIAVIMFSIVGAVVLNLAHRFHYDREERFKNSYIDYINAAENRQIR